ncbi:Cysteine-rich secretory protein family protein [Bacillus sp. THAF10]|uniref:CAP domain-containing protein n=1 Tax=Bacillus sp. THAF10 TaxID=2587848 RepID=UPI0012686039|nr:CAP domain-containing protein [Bacillus sp. THAF10]QFT89197.1 Cysteine-rich secretory protein family protein [Bacillus sp. THAF10]
MKINKKSIFTAVTTAAILTAAPFGLSAKAESNAPAKPTCDLSNVTSLTGKQFKSHEDAKAFLDNYMKELESKYGVKVQMNGAPAEAAEKQAPKEEQKQEAKAPEKAEAPKEEAQAPAPQKTEQAEKPAAEKQAADGEVSEFEQKVVELTNAEREKGGLAPLELDAELSKVAKEKSNDMQKNNYFSHNSPTYGSPFDMMKQFGVEYKTAGENIAQGQQSPEEVVNAWMNSEGHRANIMNENFTHIGVGHVEEGNYWTQMFIGK